MFARSGKSGVRICRAHWSYPSDRDPRLLVTSTCSLSQAEDRIEFSLRLRLESTQFLIAPLSFELRRPRIVRTVVGEYECFQNGRRLETAPVAVTVPSMAAFVKDAITSNDRRLPIVLFSREPSQNTTLGDPADLADTVVGLAEVYTLADRWAAFALTDQLGKQFSCYNGAVRVYYPGFSLGDDPFGHPLLMPSKLLDMKFIGRSLSNYLFQRLAAISTVRFTAGPVHDRAMAALARERQEEVDRVRKEAEEKGDIEGLFKIAEEENSKLREENASLKLRNEELENDLQTAKTNLATMWADAQASRGEVETQSAIPNEPTPKSVREAVDMATEKFGDTLLFLKSAYSSADESPYSQPDRVLQALLAMDEVCKVWRESKKNRKSMGSFEDAFIARECEYKAKESMTSKGKWGEEYEVTYKGSKASIEQHLALGKGSPTSCLRIHFLLDEGEGKFVIAHVGRHKTNTKS